MQDSWTDVRVLITGGSQGIGLGIARAFVEVGAKVVITGRDATRLASACDKLPAPSGGVDAVVGDVSHRKGCTSLAREAIARLGGLDVLCTNAGVYPELRIEDLDDAHLDGILNTNLKGTVYVLQACLTALRASSRGRVVVTSSITGPTTGYPGLSAYAASKAAQLGFVRTAALELAPAGITVNAICPGSIRSEGLEGLGEEAMAAMRRCIPVDRLGEPEDIAATALFLAGRHSGFITGQAITVDGGQTLPELPGL